MRMNITILGAGAWGTALACHAASRHVVQLWGRDAVLMQGLRTRGENTRYLPGIALPETLGLTSDLGAALAHAGAPGGSGLLVLATPVAGLRSVAQAMREHAQANAAAVHPVAGGVEQVLILAKGFERGSGLLPHAVLEQMFAGWAGRPAIGVLSGPSFAQEVARGLPVALTVASADAGLMHHAVQALHGGGMRIYASGDLIGVEVGGAVKNVLAIACGVSDGLGQGHNARAALITRGLAEMSRLGLALGAQMETFMGLSGLGDLVLTCTGELSRNRRVGLQLAAGKTLDRIVAELGHVAEGVPTAQTVLELAHSRGVAMPITAAVADLLGGRCSATDALRTLLAREPQPEAGATSAPTVEMPTKPGAQA
ncbi:glycerol-3-phosphate dehydrogenase (NAD+) [Thiomonas sp. X19]|nr:glycerol-3-phosphate dehydrogenase (NAD+) [Thiomonas sp. X19]